MIISPFRFGIAAIAVALLVSGTGRAADETRPTTTTKAAPAGSQRTSTSAGRGPAGRGVLPDPALLDGSAQPAEKKSEYGMIGDFELPGDENSRSGKVGGQQNQNPAGAQGGSMPMGMPQAGGGAPGQQQPQGAQSAQQGGQQSGAQQAGGAQAGGPQNPNAGGNPVAGAGDQGGQPQGIQVAELGGNPSGQQPQGGGPAGAGEKPPQVAIGDSAMRIDQSANQAGVVGAQQQQIAGQTQQHEKGTGSGGKGSGGSAGGNRIEKGRAIPAGL